MANHKLAAWQPLQQANYTGDEPPEAVAMQAERWGCSIEMARARMDVLLADVTYWVNDIYQVQMTPMQNDHVHLNIRRRDGNAILRDWRHFQLIKNQLIGEECEAVELYPAESRLVDTSNKYHLWCVKDPTYRFPLGFQYRDVMDAQLGDAPGLKQRKFPRGGIS